MSEKNHAGMKRGIFGQSILIEKNGRLCIIAIRLSCGGKWPCGSVFMGAASTELSEYYLQDAFLLGKALATGGLGWCLEVALPV